MQDEATKGDQAALRREPIPPFILNIIRAFGAGLMVFGSMVAFNTGGITALLIEPDGTIEYIMGGAFFAAGLLEFALIPRLLAQVRNPDK
jgi:hypothetical protein